MTDAASKFQWKDGVPTCVKNAGCTFWDGTVCGLDAQATEYCLPGMRRLVRSHRALMFLCLRAERRFRLHDKQDPLAEQMSLALIEAQDAAKTVLDKPR